MSKFIEVTKIAIYKGEKVKVKSIINTNLVRFVDNYEGHAVIYFADGKFDPHLLSNCNPIILEDKFEDIVLYF